MVGLAAAGYIGIVVAARVTRGPDTHIRPQRGRLQPELL